MSSAHSARSRRARPAGWYLRQQLARAVSRLLAAAAGALAAYWLLRAMSLPWLGVLVIVTAGFLLLPWLRGMARLWRGLKAELRVARALRGFPGMVAHSVDLGGLDADHVACGQVIAAVETKGVGGKVTMRDGRLSVAGRPLRADPLGQARQVATRLGRASRTSPCPVVCLAWCSGVLLNVDGVLVVSPDRLVHGLSLLPASPPGQLEAMRAFLAA